MLKKGKKVQLATCSAEKARRLLGYKTQTKLDDALSKMVQHQIKGVKNLDITLT